MNIVAIFLPVFYSHIYLLPLIFSPGIGAPEGCGSPLKWDAEIGPLTGGFNTQCSVVDWDEDGFYDLIVNHSIGGGAHNTFGGWFVYKNTGKINSSGIPIFVSPRRLEIADQPSVITAKSKKSFYLAIHDRWFKLPPKFQSLDLSLLPNNFKSRVDWNGDEIPDLLCDENLSVYWPSPSVWKPIEPPYNSDGIWKGGSMSRSLRLFLGVQSANDSVQWQDQGLIPVESNSLEIYGSPEPVLADWDQDGDQDLLVGAQTELVYFENIGTQQKPALRWSKKVQVGNRFDLPGLFLRPVLFPTEKNRPTDLLLAQESGNITLLYFLGLDERSVPRFSTEAELSQLGAYLDVGCLAVLSIVDWDGDSDLDIISGNSYGEVIWFENSGNKKEPKFLSKKSLTAESEPIVIKSGANGSIQGPGEAHFGYTCPVACDWNRNGKLDLILSDAWGKYTYYERKTIGSDLSAGVPIRVEGGKVESYKPPWVWWTPKDSELVTPWRCQPAVVDWDQDGTWDLISLDNAGYLALYRGLPETKSPVVYPPERAFLLTNETPIRVNPGVGGRSGRTRIVIADWDGDGDRDLIRGCTHAGDHEDPNFAMWERVAVWYENSGDDRHFTFRGDLLKKDDGVSFCGHATSPAIVDWDGDGALDLLLGAEDGLIYFFSRKFLDQ